MGFVRARVYFVRELEARPMRGRQFDAHRLSSLK
jgi:hypothetical protein